MRTQTPDLRSHSLASASLFVGNTGKYGKGVFTSKAINCGDSIYLLDGVTVTLSESVRRILLKKELPDDPLQVGRRTYLDLDDFSRLFNHSCDPTAGIRQRSELFALRDIKAGEQITYDYSATISPTVWSMKCRCGSPICRKIIGDIRSIPPEQLQHYKKSCAIQRYMKPLLQSIEDGTYVVPNYELRAISLLDQKGQVGGVRFLPAK